LDARVRPVHNLRCRANLPLYQLKAGAGATYVQIGDILSLFDEEMRSERAILQGVALCHDSGHARRVVGPSPAAHDNCIIHSRLNAASADAAIRAEIGFFAARRRSFEWKVYGHDEPADLADRLRRFGFVAEGRETVVVAELPLGSRPGLAVADIRICRIVRPEQLGRLVAVQEQVWLADQAWLRDALTLELTADPPGIEILVAESDVVGPLATSWMRLHPATCFASLWGAATLQAYRRRGIYQSLVQCHASTAAAAGARFLTVDANDNSRPVLERIGFVALTEVQGFVWAPPA